MSALLSGHADSALYMTHAEETTTWMLFYKSAASAPGIFLYKVISPIAFHRAYLINESACGCLLTSPAGYKLAYAETSKVH